MEIKKIFGNFEKVIDPMAVIGIAFVLAALVAGYYVVKKSSSR